MFEDDLILDVFVYLESATTVANLGAASKIMWTFTSEEEIWKELCLNEFDGDWRFESNWRRTYIKRRAPQFEFPNDPEDIPFFPKVSYIFIIMDESYLFAHLTYI
jgi:hypothetical protein